MKIFITSTGDTSVGISSGDATIETYDILEKDDDRRQPLREALATAFTAFWDDPAQVWFEDECPDCGLAVKEGECTNKDCVGYPHEDNDD